MYICGCADRLWPWIGVWFYFNSYRSCYIYSCARLKPFDVVDKFTHWLESVVLSISSLYSIDEERARERKSKMLMCDVDSIASFTFNSMSFLFFFFLACCLCLAGDCYDRWWLLWCIMYYFVYIYWRRHSVQHVLYAFNNSDIFFCCCCLRSRLASIRSYARSCFIYFFSFSIFFCSILSSVSKYFVFSRIATATVDGRFRCLFNPS